ncbi:MAG TPA: D-glycerate dehydrogenase, partial [Rhodospirillaceae bacterium]|nr:D-glycerate dehydrogenase [Rhodospirillaceae bacterium]
PDSVKIIANFSVGYDHVDVKAAAKHGVVVTNTPEVLSDATAETTILLMLGAARRASEGERLVRSGGWKDWSPAFMVGVAVTGKRLGILGMGRVGQAVADLARAFRMEIHYHNRSRLSPDKEKGAVFHETLEDMLPHCDFLSLHCNVTEETRGIMDAKRFALLPDGAVLANAARGAVIDDDALIDALKSGKLFAAGIDAYNNEPNVDPRIAALDNTFLLPHIGSANRETRDAMGFRALDNLDAFFAGREPGDRVA